MPAPKPSHFRTAHKNQVIFDHPHKNQVNFDTHTTRLFLTRSQKISQLRPPTQEPSQSILTLKTSHFRPAHKNKVNFDPHTKAKSISIHTLRPSHFRGAHKKSKFRPPAFVFRMGNPCLIYGMITVPTLAPMSAPRIIRFVVHSDDLLNPEYGRSAIRAGRPILIPSTFYCRP